MPKVAKTPWEKLSPLPDVHARYRAKHSFEALAERYEELPKEPLMVRAELFEPVVPAEPRGALHLDSLLSSCVLDSHPVAPLYRRGFPAAVPLPVELAWCSDEGRPLWTCSELRAQGDVLRAPFHYHKRYPEDRAHLSKKVRAETRRGRWKEYRVPLSGVVAPELRAVCVGNAEEVARLLGYVTHVGKKVGYGFGRVSWSVDVLDMPVETVRGVALHTRPVPAKYLMEEEGGINLKEGTGFTRRSWCPPHWFSPNYDLATIRG